MNDGLNGHIMKELVGLRPKTYSYLKDNNDEKKTTKGTEECVIKIKLILNSFDSIDLIESYARRTSKDLECRKEEIRYITI